MAKEYLGDSVYADLDEFGDLVLTIENGYGPTNTIVCDTDVGRALVEYIKALDDCRWLMR